MGKRYTVERKTPYKKAKKHKKIRNALVASLLTVTFFPSLFSFVSAINKGDNKNKKDILQPTSSTQSMDNKSGTETVKNMLGVGTSSTIENVEEFLKSDTGKILKNYCHQYGVPSEIMASIAMQESSLCHEECIPGGSMYSGYGVGLFQLESPDINSYEITAHNYTTGEDDSLFVDMNTACSIEGNIKAACLLFQNSLINNNGNVLLAIQAHNYGQPMVDLVLMQNNSTIDEIKSNYSDISWIDWMKDANINPNKYISDWSGAYGDGNYLKNVLSHCPKINVSYKYNDEVLNLDLLTGNVKSVYEGVKISYD